MVKVVTKSTIDLGTAAKALPLAIREELLIAARLVIADIVERVQRGVKLSGHAQRQNFPATQADKRKRLGHNKPLVESGKLGRERSWRINGVSPERARTPRTSKVRIDHPLVTETTFGKRGYAGRYYADFLPHLERRGYRVPIGISRQVLRKITRLPQAAARAALANARRGKQVRPRMLRAAIERAARVG